MTTDRPRVVTDGRFRAAPLVGAALFVAAFLLQPAISSAGPWIKSPGKGYVKVSGSAFESDRVFDIQGDLEEPEFDYRHRAILTYAELGLAPRVGLAFALPVIYGTNEINERLSVNRWGAGDLFVAPQLHLYSNRSCSASFQAGFSFPLYDEILTDSGAVTSANPGASGAERFTPALGDGSIDFTPLLSYGCSSADVPVWLSVSAGPNFRFRGFGDGLTWSTDGGIFLIPQSFALTVRAGGVQRFASPVERPTKSYMSTGVGFLVNVYEGFALEGGFSYIPSGAFVARGWDLHAGISYTGPLFPNPFD